QYTYCSEDAPVEIVTLRVQATGALQKLAVPQLSPPGPPTQGGESVGRSAGSGGPGGAPPGGGLGVSPNSSLSPQNWGAGGAALLQGSGLGFADGDREQGHGRPAPGCRGTLDYRPARPRRRHPNVQLDLPYKRHGRGRRRRALGCVVRRARRGVGGTPAVQPG